MGNSISLAKCQAYIDSHVQALKGTAHGAKGRERRPAVTISRETGAGGISIAERLADYLQARTSKSCCPWTIFDKNLVLKVLEDHDLPLRTGYFMPEDTVSEIRDSLEELLGLHPPAWKLVRQTAETILHLVELGHVIIVGRGANVIAGRMDHVFHVRLVGSPEKRVERVQKRYKLTRRAAMAFIGKEESGRRRYVKYYFGKDITDPLQYHLVLNTDHFSLDEAAQLIGDAVLTKFR